MTSREFYNLVSAENATITEEMITYAQEQIAKLDAAKANRKPTAKQKANAVFADQIFAENFDGQPSNTVTASQIATQYSVTPQKASAILRGLVQAGKLTESQVKGEKGGKVKGYSVAC